MTKLILTVTLALFACSCGGAQAQIVPQDTPPAQGGGGTIVPFNPGPMAYLFHGKYWFKGRGNNNNGTHPFHEYGVVMADGAGHWTLHSMSNNETDGFHSIAGIGNYQIAANGVGTESQDVGQCPAGLPPPEIAPNCPADHAALFITADGKKVWLVAMEGWGTWEVEMEREGDATFPPLGSLASCTINTGSVLNCNDGWAQAGVRGWN